MASMLSSVRPDAHVELQSQRLPQFKGTECAKDLCLLISNRSTSIDATIGINNAMQLD